MERNAETRKTNKTVGYNYSMDIEIICKKGDVDIKDLKSFSKKLAKRSVTIGVHKAEGNKINDVSKTKLIDYACYNEFGHPENAGADGRPPSRSFVRKIANDSKARNEIKQKEYDEMTKIAQAHFKGNTNEMINNMYSEVGKVALDCMIYYIENSSQFYIGNADRTIKNKGFDHPLLDTGLLVKSLRVKIRGNNDAVLKVPNLTKGYVAPEQRGK